MKFLVDEMPNYVDDCPLSKRGWDDGYLVDICTLNNERCNLQYNSIECYGLKELKRNR